MADSMIRSAQELFADDEASPDSRLGSWLRERDRLGALPQMHAALDDAYAIGHARGVEETRGEQLDALRTLLTQILEARFGEISDEAMDQIAVANQAVLEHWILSAATEASLESALAG